MELRYNLVLGPKVFDLHLPLLGSPPQTRLKAIAVINLDDINNGLVV